MLQRQFLTAQKLTSKTNVINIPLEPSEDLFKRNDIALHVGIDICNIRDTRPVA